ncbi:MAG: alkaline phosphatase family protein [Capsulimonadales bacterium]|nr:alkaline phosphatase family protein [Capsulimonadales bacterium]
MRNSTRAYLGLLSIPCIAAAGVTIARARQSVVTPTAIPLVTGKFLTPEGAQTNVGSYPCNLALSPDGRFVAVTTLGARSRVSMLRTDTGDVAGKVDFEEPAPGRPGRREGAFYGLAFVGSTLYAARGSDDRVTPMAVGADGSLTRNASDLVTPSSLAGRKPNHVAGIAFSSDGKTMYSANNTIDPASPELQGSVSVTDVASGSVRATIATPGYPFAVAALTVGPNADKKVYVTSEQRGNLVLLDPTAARVAKTIPVGASPSSLLLNKAQDRLYVAVSGSDTIAVVDTSTDKIVRTILLRPADLRGIPSVTPQGMAFSTDERLLFVALSDLNAVGVVDADKGQVLGYIPTGWYPTAVAYAPNGKLFVANAKGIAARNPNDKPNPEIPGRSQYIQNIIEGTVSAIDFAGVRPNLAAKTEQVLKNNRTAIARKPEKFVNPGIEHVIYIIKENRTYDQVLSDLPVGNGDKSLLMFGREVTPNQHALAERFVLLDNFYCCAEVSGDGWNWSTQGMVTAYNSRNVVYGYTGKEQPYDYEGTNNGVPVDLMDVPDVSRTAGGYIWDRVGAKKLPYRNYGFFVDDFQLPRNNPEAGPEGNRNTPAKKALTGTTCRDFYGYDTSYADSEAWVKYNLPPAPKQMKTFGKFNDPARMTAWLREFNEYVRNKNLPRFMMVRLGRDHTAGTAAGQYSPRAMVADNDYAVGQLVEAISKSPYWKKTAIFVIEDDSQAGFDHVDAHRSIAFVISPFIRKGTVDSRFYNTDSMLRTMGLLMGTDPLNHYDAAATPFGIFTAASDNDTPYDAILPAKEIIGEINRSVAYRSADSERLLNPRREESEPDEELNDILWHAIKGVNTPKPPRRFGMAGFSAPDRD